jgi:hypothetical protein
MFVGGFASAVTQEIYRAGGERARCRGLAKN